MSGWWWVSCPHFALLRFLDGIVDALLLVKLDTRANFAVPGWPVGYQIFPVIWVDAAAFEGHFQYILVAFLWTSLGTLTSAKLPIKELLWETLIRHSDNVSCPPEL